MNKRITVSSFFLIGLLVFSYASLAFGNFASASDVLCNFLPNYYQNGLDNPNEVQLSIDTTAYISNTLSQYPRYTIYDCTYDDYWVTIEAAQSYNNIVTYSKGHRGKPYGDQHIGLVSYTGKNIVDHEIYDLTSSKNVVTFIWHCQTAKNYIYGGPNTYPPLGAVGMPYAWTNNNNMIQYGTSGSQVYLGWEDKTPLTVYNSTLNPPQYHNVTLMGNYTVGSPQYEWGIDPYYNYADVACLFWYYMDRGYTTTQALNQMSYDVFFNLMPFAYSPLNDWLIVYGNGNVGLPSTSPSPPPTYYATSATPSKTGNGYVNNENNILGVPDWSYAYLNSGSFGNKAEITARFSNAPISGQLYVRCYTSTSSGANLKIYVGNQYGVWTTVVNTNLYPPNSVMNINCGYVTNIDKVSVVAYHEYNGYPSYINVDAVWVQ